MEIRYSEKAVKQIRKIHKGDYNSAEMILKAIETFADNPSRTPSVKALKGKYGDLKRLRVGNYRVIFDSGNGVMLIYEVKHRKEAYRD